MWNRLFCGMSVLKCGCSTCIIGLSQRRQTDRTHIEKTERFVYNSRFPNEWKWLKKRSFFFPVLAVCSEWWDTQYLKPNGFCLMMAKSQEESVGFIKVYRNFAFAFNGWEINPWFLRDTEDTEWILCSSWPDILCALMEQSMKISNDVIL